MIRVNDDWVIDIDEHNYITKRDKHKTTKQKQKNGTMKEVQVFEIEGYHPSLIRALERIGEEILRDRLRGADMSLTEAVNAIKECTIEWRELVRLVKQTAGEEI